MANQFVVQLKNEPGAMATLAEALAARGVDLRAIGGSALTAAIDVPKGRSADEMGHGIPATYVPARNTILLGLALGYAETVGAFDLFIGANVLDYSGYPDCRPEFLAAFEGVANLATKAGTEGTGRFRVHAPLLKLTKAEIIREGVRLGVDYAGTLSCYDPDAAGRACGRCDSCQLRRKGFQPRHLLQPDGIHLERCDGVRGPAGGQQMFAVPAHAEYRGADRRQSGREEDEGSGERRDR